MLPFIFFNLLLASAKRHSSYPVPELDERVSIVLPAYGEPCDQLRLTLESLHRQDFLKKNDAEFVLVDGEPCHSELKDLYDLHVKAPLGKLRARHSGIISSTGDIIVSVDGDTYYPPNWLSAMLLPYEDQSTVMTICQPSAYDPVIEAFLHLPIHLHSLTLASGRASTFKKEAYLRLGGFPLQETFRDTKEMQLVEEYGLKLAMSGLGRVVYVPVVVYHLKEWFMDDNSDRGLRKALIEERLRQPGGSHVREVR